MRRLRSATAVATAVASCALAGVLPLLLIPPGLSQPGMPPVPPPPPPAAPLLLADPTAEELSRCVPSYGHTGCAARLYARLLCDVVGLSVMPEGLQQQLDGQYERAAIDFRGITVQQVESAAVRYYVPMLCPSRSRQIQELFAPLADPAG